MKKVILAMTMVVSLLSLTACNTVAGVGKDVSEGGQALQRAAK